MTINLEFIRETDLARLYRRKDGTEFWLPRSIIGRTFKWHARDGKPPIHEVDVPTWKAKELGIE